MLVTILKRNFAKTAAAGFLALAVFLTSCKTKEEAPLIADPRGTHETALPWNQQQKWEREGEAAALNQQRR